MTDRNIVLLSTADWDNPFWTNKQHVAVCLAKRGYRVLYVDSLGLRRPSISGRDFRRIFRRVFKAMRPPRLVRKNLWVWSPITLPFNSVPVIRKLNRWMLGSGLAIWKRRLGMRAAVLWTYNPLSTELIQTDGWKKLIYHCVDEIKAQPGMPAQTLERAENDLVKRADLVFVTSVTLQKARSEINKRTHYMPNVADFHHFNLAMKPETRVPIDLQAISRPRIGFVGAISGYKIDFSLLREVAARNPQWSLVLIGEVGEGDPWTDSSVLKNVPNIHLLGPRSYAQLPSYLKGMDVAILPNVLNEYTAAMFPMKFFEYLAAGLPVVSTQLASLREYSGEAYLADSAGDFVDGIARALSGQGASLEARLALASAHTYESRMDRMLELMSERIA